MAKGDWPCRGFRSLFIGICARSKKTLEEQGQQTRKGKTTKKPKWGLDIMEGKNSQQEKKYRLEAVREAQRHYKSGARIQCLELRQNFAC
jgi:hypothetical protein